jgi:hypothetical protein
MWIGRRSLPWNGGGKKVLVAPAPTPATKIWKSRATVTADSFTNFDFDLDFVYHSFIMENVCALECRPIMLTAIGSRKSRRSLRPSQMVCCSPNFLLSCTNSDLGIAVQQQIVSSLLRIMHQCKSTLDTSTRMDRSFLDNRARMLSADLCGQGVRVMTL